MLSAGVVLRAKRAKARQTAVASVASPSSALSVRSAGNVAWRATPAARMGSRSSKADVSMMTSVGFGLTGDGRTIGA